jgi:hypothetical protein
VSDSKSITRREGVCAASVAPKNSKASAYFMVYLYRPLTTGNTNTREKDQRLESFGSPVAT